MEHPMSVEYHNQICPNSVLVRQPNDIIFICETCHRKIILPLEDQIREATESWKNNIPAHYSFSRRYYEGGYRCSEWYGLGFTGTKYYSSFYQNMGSMLMEISKEDFEKGMAANLANQRENPWDTVRISAPNWQMMPH